jgi:hypothetical protein
VHRALVISSVLRYCRRRIASDAPNEKRMLLDFRMVCLSSDDACVLDRLHVWSVGQRHDHPQVAVEAGANGFSYMHSQVRRFGSSSSSSNIHLEQLRRIGSIKANRLSFISGAQRTLLKRASF